MQTATRSDASTSTPTQQLRPHHRPWARITADVAFTARPPSPTPNAPTRSELAHLRVRFGLRVSFLFTNEALIPVTERRANALTILAESIVPSAPPFRPLKPVSLVFFLFTSVYARPDYVYNNIYEPDERRAPVYVARHTLSHPSGILAFTSPPLLPC